MNSMKLGSIIRYNSFEYDETIYIYKERKNFSRIGFPTAKLEIHV